VIDSAIDEAIAELAPLIGTRAACRATGRAQANHYRRHRQSAPALKPRPDPRPQPRALRASERAAVLDVLHDERFVDAAPATVYATLLDEGTYLASESSMYRILRSAGEVRERRRHATHPPKVKPELVASARTRSGRGTSPSCSARRSGPTTTSTP
jgi:putative transposase